MNTIIYVTARCYTSGMQTGGGVMGWSWDGCSESTGERIWFNTKKLHASESDEIHNSWGSLQMFFVVLEGSNRKPQTRSGRLVWKQQMDPELLDICCFLRLWRRIQTLSRTQPRRQKWLERVKEHANSLIWRVGPPYLLHRSFDLKIISYYHHFYQRINA